MGRANEGSLDPEFIRVWIHCGRGWIGSGGQRLQVVASQALLCIESFKLSDGFSLSSCEME